MAEPFLLDDPPAAEPSLGGEDDGKVQCPECPNRYKSSGLQRHITMAHRDGISDNTGASNNTRKQPKSSQVIETRWADFQRGAALLVSLACSQCAAALSEDAEKDAKALAQFCEHKPKLRKQVEDFLSTADFLLLVGAFGGTAQKMVAHHSIGKRIPGLTPVENTDHGNHSPADKAMAFMEQMPAEARHQMMDQVFAANREKQVQQEVQQEQAASVATFADVVGGDGAGAEPVPEDTPLTEHDKAMREAMTASNPVFMETVGSLVG